MCLFATAYLIAAKLDQPVVSEQVRDDSYPHGSAKRRLVMVQEPVKDFFELLYFSVITVTTTGYGDLKPAGAWPRLLASIETSAFWLLVVVCSLQNLPLAPVLCKTNPISKVPNQSGRPVSRSVAFRVVFTLHIRHEFKKRNLAFDFGNTRLAPLLKVGRPVCPLAPGQLPPGLLDYLHSLLQIDQLTLSLGQVHITRQAQFGLEQIIACAEKLCNVIIGQPVHFRMI